MKSENLVFVTVGVQVKVLVTVLSTFLAFVHSLPFTTKVNKSFFSNFTDSRALFPPKVGLKSSYFTMTDENRELSSSNFCKRCNNPVGTGLKCRKCGVVSHRSCLKAIKAKFYDDSSVDCCGNNPVQVKTSNPTTTETANINMDVGKTVEQISITYLEEIIRQKDLIISNQAMLIDSLQAQIALLYRDTSAKPDNIPSTSNQVSFSDVVNNKKTKTKSVNKKESVEQHNTVQIRPSAVSRAIHNAHASKVCQELVNLTRDLPVKAPAQRNTRKLLVGNSENDSGNLKFKSAKDTKMNHFHVTNCDPDTTHEDLLVYLKTIVPVIQVETLKSRNPTQYSSFKISVPSEDVSMILKPELWPSGVIINKFFRAKNQNKPNGKDP